MFNNYDIVHVDGEPMIRVKALSLKQPWANYIAECRKSIETRTWGTKYRGDIVICSSKSGKIEPRGVALAVVELIGVRPMTKEDEDFACCEIYPRAMAWILSDIRPIRPIPVKGALGLFNLVLDTDKILFKPLRVDQFDDIPFTLPNPHECANMASRNEPTLFKANSKE